jgi:hypothetical protein
MRSKIRDSLQTGIRSGFLPARSDAVRRFRLAGCDALTGTLQTGIRFALPLLVVTPSGVLRISLCYSVYIGVFQNLTVRSDKWRIIQPCSCYYDFISRITVELFWKSGGFYSNIWCEFDKEKARESGTSLTF